MKPLLYPLLALGLGLTPVWSETVTEAFAADLGDFVAGGDAGALPPTWSNFNGGSMMLDFTGGWAPAKADLNLLSSKFATVFQSALTNGGSISYDITVRTADILLTTPGTYPNWFEPMLTATSVNNLGDTLIDDRPFGGNDNFPAYYGNGAWPSDPAQQVRTTRVTLPIEAALNGVDDDGKAQFRPAATGFFIRLGLNSESGSFTGKYFVDNFSVTSNAVAVVIPPPTITLEPTVAGLNLHSSGTGQYDRQTLRTKVPQYSWIGATPATPVTYSITISDYSPKAGMGTVFYLVPGTGLGTGLNFPDYGEPRCIAGYLNNNANGSGYLRLAYKNELPNSNGLDPSSLYGGGSPNTLWPADPGYVPGSPKAPGTGMGGTLAAVSGASIKGKWSITFTSNTNITLTAPDGTTATGALPNEATAQLFAHPMYAYFGTIPGVPERIGERVVFSDIAITGGEFQISSGVEAGMLDGSLEKSASDNKGINYIYPSENPYWFTWTLPATDYVLQQSEDLGNGATWSNIPLTTSFGQPGGRRLLLSGVTLTNPEKNFLRMYKPPLVP